MALPPGWFTLTDVTGAVSINLRATAVIAVVPNVADSTTTVVTLAISYTVSQSVDQVFALLSSA